MDFALDIPNSRTRIARAVRTLRQERAWTQAELARKLGLSQSRLSEIERGDGSFTAEQFLLILTIFNVSTSRFTGAGQDQGLQLQNALARLGAHHLQESSEVVPADDLDDIVEVVGDPRQTAALAPVLVGNVDRIGLGKLYLDLAKIGRERRLAWLSENTAHAIGLELGNEPPRAWAQRARRAAVVLGAFVDSVTNDLGAGTSRPVLLDAFDPNIRSKKTLEEVTAASSAISRKWGIVSSLKSEDFAQALRAARVAHP
jgi:transcriptional regulator with XRE-family HTH domain